MSQLPSECTFSRRNHWLLLPILVIATLLRLWQINESLWLDELHSAWVVSSGPIKLVERAQIGNQSPLYFYLPWVTTSLLGMSEWALRLPSLVAGVGLVAVAYGLTYQLTRSRIAASACSILTALDHNFLFYATEVRPYACVQFVAAVQLYIFWRLQDDARGDLRLAFVAFSVLLFYLHYTAILLLAGEILYLLTRSLWRRRQADAAENVFGNAARPVRWPSEAVDSLKCGAFDGLGGPSYIDLGTGCEYTHRKLAIDLVCIAAMTIPMAAHLLEIGSRRSAWASFVNDTSLLLPAYWFSLVSYVGVPSGTFLVGVLLCRRGHNSDGRKYEWQHAYLLVCWLCVPLAIVWLLTVADVARLYLGRYVIGAALAPVLFAGLCVGVWASRRSQTLVASLIIAYALCSSRMIEQWRYDGRLFGDRVENWRDAVGYVNADRIYRDLVFVRSGLIEADRLASDESELLRNYCVSPVASIYQVDRPASQIWPLTTSHSGSLTSQDVQRIEQAGSAWFIVNGTSATRERCRERILEALSETQSRAFDVARAHRPLGPGASSSGRKPNATYFEPLALATGLSARLKTPRSPTLERTAQGEIQRGLILKEQQFGNVGVFLVILFTIDDQVTPLGAQPTSPKSIASP